MALQPDARHCDGVRPEETRFVQEVFVDMRPTGVRLACQRCECDEVVLLEASEFDDCVKRFMRTHPTACSAGA